MKIFAERLKALRAEKGISLMTLAKAIDTSDSSIFRWENDQNEITAPLLARIAKYFDVTADYLLGLED